MFMVVKFGPITLKMLINTIPHGRKLSGKFRKLITELIINCYMALMIVYLSILH